MKDNDRVSIKAAIEKLREELSEAAAAAPTRKERQFRVDDVELELTLVIDDSASGGGEFNWWVIKGKAELASKSIITHKVRLKLNVGEVFVGDEAGQTR